MGISKLLVLIIMRLPLLTLLALTPIVSLAIQVQARIDPTGIEEKIQILNKYSKSQAELEKQFTKDIGIFINNRDSHTDDNGDNQEVINDFEIVKSDYDQINNLTPLVLNSRKQAKQGCLALGKEDIKKLPQNCYGVLHLNEYRYKAFLDDIQSRYIGVSILFNQYLNQVSK